VELLLVLVVLLLLLSTAVVNLDAMRHGAELREGALRLESLLRYARAEAALRGQRIRVEFRSVPPEDSDLREPDEPPMELVRLTVESAPLEDPGTFTALPARSWGNRQLGELIELELVLGGERSGSESGGDMGPRSDRYTGDRTPVARTVTFDPEGGVTAARLVVRSTDVEDTRRILVTLEGVTGQVSRRELTEEALESLQSEAEEEANGGGDLANTAETFIGGYAP
jgi:hypothetical protein